MSGFIISEPTDEPVSGGEIHLIPLPNLMPVISENPGLVTESNSGYKSSNTMALEMSIDEKPTFKRKDRA